MRDTAAMLLREFTRRSVLIGLHRLAAEFNDRPEACGSGQRSLMIRALVSALALGDEDL